MSNLPIGIFLLVVLSAAIFLAIKFKNVSKEDKKLQQDAPIVIDPVDDIFENLGIDSQVPKIVIVQKKPTPKKKTAVKKKVPVKKSNKNKSKKDSKK